MYDPFDGLGPSFHGDAVAQSRIDDAETSDPAVSAQIRIADAVVLQSIRDLVDPEGSQRARLDAARWVITGEDIPWLRGGSAPTDAVVAARHAKLLQLAKQANADFRASARPSGMSMLLGMPSKLRHRAPVRAA